MLKRGAVLIALAALLLIQTGCVKQYYYDGAQYPSAEAATIAQKQDMKNTLSKIPQCGEKSDKTLLVVYPTRPVMEEKGLQITGDPRLIDQGQKNFLLTNLENEFKFWARAMKKSGYYNKVYIKQVATPENYRVSKSQRALYLVMSAPGSAQWYLKSYEKDIETINFDGAQVGRINKTNSFIDQVIEVDKEFTAKHAQ